MSESSYVGAGRGRPGFGYRLSERCLWLGVCGLLLAGCSSVQTVQPEPLLVDGQSLGTEPAATTPDDLGRIHWWHHFDSATLNQKVEQGLEANFSLQAAWERLAQSRAIAEQQASGRSPDLTLNAGNTRQWTDTATSDQRTVRLTTEYELDFWGRVAAQQQQGDWSALATEASARVQANTTANGIVRAWYGWVYQQQVLALLEQQRQRLQQSLTATESRYRRGLAVRSDVWQQQQLLESLATDINEARRQQQLQGQQLALWTGEGSALSVVGLPSSWLTQLQASALPALLSSPDIELQALQQRPDVMRDWHRIQTNNAALAVAVANRYPRLSLAASYGGTAPKWEDVLDNWVASLAANLVLPILDGNNRKATVLQREAQVREALANYQQTLLTAIQEVRAAQVNETTVLTRIHSLESRLDLARKTEASQQRRYLRGVVNLLQLITAQRSVLSLEQQVLAARWQQLQYRIQLYLAVSHGDFQRHSEDTPSLSQPDQTGDQT